MTRGKGRGRPKGSILRKKVKQSVNVKTVLNNPPNEFEVDQEFSGGQETGTHGFTLSYSPVSVDSEFPRSRRLVHMDSFIIFSCYLLPVDIFCCRDS